MIISNQHYAGLYVWVWLPGELNPIPAGQLLVDESTDPMRLEYGYGKKYISSSNAFSLYSPELPLQEGLQQAPIGHVVASCIRDAAPDAWGRRVILNQLYNRDNKQFHTIDNVDEDELRYMALSGSDRIGALDFQISRTNYVPRNSSNASLEQLITAADMVEKGIPLTSDLAIALQHGTAVGGARPKALISDKNKKWLAKFSSSTDTYNVVKSEFVAMKLAGLCGINVAPVRIEKSMGRDVLLVERFDRELTENGWTKRHLVSALTLSGYTEGQAMFTSYSDLVNTLRKKSIFPAQDMQELFLRMVFNIAIGNTDDHARNHSVFYFGDKMQLTPAYDICAIPRVGGEASQALALDAGKTASRLELCLSLHQKFHMNFASAKTLINFVVSTIRHEFAAVCDEAQLSQVDRQRVMGRAILNPSIFYPAEGNDRAIFK